MPLENKLLMYTYTHLWFADSIFVHKTLGYLLLITTFNDG